MRTYETRKQLSDRFSISLSTVDDRLRKIRKLIPDRYPKTSFIDNEGIHRIRSDVFEDYMLNGEKIKAGIAEDFK